VSNSILNWTSRVVIAGRIAECRRPQNWNELTILGDYHQGEPRAAGRGAVLFSEPNAKYKMPVLFYLPLIIWMGLFEVAQNEMRPSWKSSRRIGDLAMTKREKGLNGRKVRMGRLVEAEMALICGKVITWFVGCRL